MSPAVSNDFSRLRPRAVEQEAAPATIDSEGKRALFSTDEPTPAFGSVTVECSSCEELSVLTMAKAGRLLMTSAHLPLLRRRYVSLVRCPACGRRTWCRVRVRI